ncbi:MAG: hypothetical protein KAG64_08380 [Bacteroidales bacterium]|nr:hypothetical protein [Bacteroidales bacterium]
MKILGFILLFLFGLFFSVPFKVVQSTQQEVVGGRMETGSSTIYLVKMVAKKPSTKLHYEDLWIGIKHYSVTASHQKPDNTISQDFEKGDTIYIQASQQYLPNDNGEKEIRAEKANKTPIEYTGKALIGYTFKGKKHYFEISDLEILSTENRP